MLKTTSLLSLTLLALTAVGCADATEPGDAGADGEDASEGGIDLTAGADASAGDASDEGASADGGADDGIGLDGGTDGGGEGGGSIDCGGEVITGALAVPKVMLVLDKSGSMSSERWDDDGDDTTPSVTRWHSLHGIVSDLLAANGSALELGAALFPADGADHHGGASEACMMADAAEVSIAADNGAAIIDAMPGADDEVLGGTPTREGIVNAIEALSGAPQDSPRAMILVTDGAANCVEGAQPFMSEYDDELALAVGSALADNGIPTYVIGIDIVDGHDENTGRNVHDELGKVAIAGGTARAGDVPFYDAGSAVELRAALDAVADRVSCSVQLGELPADPSMVGLTIGGVGFDRLESCDGASGWRFATEAAPFAAIELCGAACDAFAAEGQLETHYSCPAVG